MKKIPLPFFILVVVWVLFCFPYLFQNKVPFPSSYQVNFFSPWNAYPEFASPYKNGATPDVIGQIYPWRKFTIDTWKSGQVPLWNPYSFSGTYHLANYQSAVFSPLNFGFFVFPFIEWWSTLVLLQPLLAGLFVILFTRTLKFSNFAQIISATSFMFCGFIVTWMMYGTLGYAILFLPLALFAIEKFLQEKKHRYLVLLGMTIPLSFFSGHFQISLYFLGFVLYYIIFKFFVEKKYKKTLQLFLSVIFGLMISCVQILPSIEAYSQSLRSGIFQKIEAIPWVYLPTFIAPDFFGNPVTRNDWFGHYAEWNVYVGIIPLFFAVYSLFRIRQKEIMIFALPFFASFLLAFPSPLLDLLITLKIPVVSTSAASRIVVLFSFSAVMLAGYGFMGFLQDLKKKKYLPIISTLIMFVVSFCILWAVVVGNLFIDSDKIQIAFSNLRLPSIIFILFTICLFSVVFIRKDALKKIFISIIIFLCIFDSLRFVTKWQPFDPKELVFKDLKLFEAYSLVGSSDRVYANIGAEGIMYYNLSGVEGYDAVYINRYGEFIASLKNGKLESSARSVVSFPKESLHATSAANFLGIKYIIHKVSDGQNSWAFPYWKYDPKSLNLIYDDKVYEVLENTNAYPRAFFVENVIVENDPQKILDTMLDSEISLRNTAVIEENINLKNLATGSATIISYSPNVINIQTELKSNGFLVLTDSFSPGWNAYLDKRKINIYRTDFAFKGVEVPGGSHNLIFKYEPASFLYGIYIAIIGFVGLLILGFFGFFKKKKHG